MLHITKSVLFSVNSLPPPNVDDQPQHPTSQSHIHHFPPCDPFHHPLVQVMLGRYLTKTQAHALKHIHAEEQAHNSGAGGVTGVRARTHFSGAVFTSADVRELQKELDESFKDAWRRPLACSWLVIWVSAVFVMCVSLDISCDTYSVAESIWLTLVSLQKRILTCYALT